MRGSVFGLTFAAALCLAPATPARAQMALSPAPRLGVYGAGYGYRGPVRGGYYGARGRRYSAPAYTTRNFGFMAPFGYGGGRYASPYRYRAPYRYYRGRSYRVR